jgi:hypothetical protein
MTATGPTNTAGAGGAAGGAVGRHGPAGAADRNPGLHGGILYQERLSATPRSWVWLVVASAVTFIAIAPIIVPLTVVAWLVNVARYAHSLVGVDADRIWVGRRSVRLAALDLSTLGRASNTWPWRAFNQRYLGANPIWTRDSVGIRGVDGGLTYWVSLGTNHRDQLVAVLERAIPEAKARAEAAAAAYAGLPLPPAGWHDDPWQPASRLRWWDGTQWTGYTAPRPGAAPFAGPGSAPGASS